VKQPLVPTRKPDPFIVSLNIPLNSVNGPEGLNRAQPPGAALFKIGQLSSDMEYGK